MIIQRQSPFLKLFPVQIFISFALYNHFNAIFHRANQLAEIATNTFLFFNCIGVVWFTISEADRLMRCIFAGYITKPAVNTFILVNMCYMVIIDIKIFPMRKR